MIEINKCQNCAANLEHRTKGSTCGLFCERCDKWVIVTTYISEIRRDKTKYKMYLLSADSKNKQHITALAKAVNINFLEAKKMIQEDKYLILEDEAVAIKRVRDIFHNFSIEYDIEPLFPY